MYIHNLDPVIFNLGFLSLRWYSVAYILGIIIGWWYGKKILSQICLNNNINFKISLFDDYISYVIISIILGGRIGYILFYNLEFYFYNPVDIGDNTIPNGNAIMLINFIRLGMMDEAKKLSDSLNGYLNIYKNHMKISSV